MTNNPSGSFDQNLKPKPSIDILLSLSKTDPTLTEPELISEANLIILAVRSNTQPGTASKKYTVGGGSGSHHPLSVLGMKKSFFLLQGYETTAIAIASTLFMLAMHPDVQEKAYQELWDVFGNSGRDITKPDFQNLPYLEMVIKETLRMFPTIPGFMRKSGADLNIGK